MKRFVRWWSFNQSLALLGAVVLAATGLFRVTQGAGFKDVSSVLASPFRPDGQVQQQLLDAQTQALQQQIEELKAQNQSLQTLLNLQPLPSYRRIVAPVMLRSADNWWQQLTLGKGSLDGIKPDSVVVAPGGLVGRVKSVSPKTSLVLLATDPTSQIGITLTRSRQVGILQGRTGREGILDFFEKSPDVQLNDPVVTSKLSSRFPPGIVIGRVIKLDLDHLPTPQARVEFSAPIDNLEWVNVLVNG